MNLEKEVQKLMDLNQAMKAWELVKDTPGDLRVNVYKKVRHAFSDEEYRKYYGQELIENPMPLEQALNCIALHDRLAWAFQTISNKVQRFVCDLGCADGYFCLTLARLGHVCVGVNLYRPSVDLANYRAIITRLGAYFVCEDIFDHVGRYDAVVMLEVLEHLPDPKKGIEKAFSLLRDGGSLYISTPRTDHIGIEEHLKEKNRAGWNDGKPSGHLRLYTEEEFKALLEGYNIAQFTVDSERCMLVEIIK